MSQSDVDDSAMSQSDVGQSDVGKLGFVVVEGPIGVGKTSLAIKLAESLGSETVLEQPEDNPFLERFYKDPERAALPTQLAFLIQRATQMQELRQSDMFRPALVADYIMEKDRLFARITLDTQEYELYETVYQHLVLNVPKPDLVVYLQAPVDVLQERIARRGRRNERHIEDRYLERLVDSYSDYFLNYHDAPLLIVNAAGINPVDDEQDYTILLDRIRNMRGGRQYFNPLPATWS